MGRHNEIVRVQQQLFWVTVALAVFAGPQVLPQLGELSRWLCRLVDF